MLARAVGEGREAVQVRGFAPMQATALTVKVGLLEAPRAVEGTVATRVVRAGWAETAMGMEVIAMTMAEEGTAVAMAVAVRETEACWEVAAWVTVALEVAVVALVVRPEGTAGVRAPYQVGRVVMTVGEAVLGAVLVGAAVMAQTLLQRLGWAARGMAAREMAAEVVGVGLVVVVVAVEAAAAAATARVAVRAVAPQAAAEAAPPW